jgi:hypothetical protein
MSTPALSQPELAAYLFVALFGFLVLRRAYAMTHGARATVFRLTVLPALYIAIYLATLVGTWYVATGPGLAWFTTLGIPVDLGLMVAGFVFAFVFTRRTVELYQPPGDPAWHYRLHAWLAVAYVALFFVRVGIEAAVIGISPFAFPTTAQFASMSPLAVDSLFIVDALWGFSTGLLVGRSLAVYAAWKAAEAKAPAPLPG